MKRLAKLACWLILAPLLSGNSFAMQDSEVGIVPRPVKMERLHGSFAISGQTRITSNASELKDVGDYLSGIMLEETGLRLAHERANAKMARAIRLEIDQSHRELGSEGYLLHSSPEGVTITATRPAGVFYGIQTLRQLLLPNVQGAGQGADQKLEIPCVDVTDYPRFQWRGILVDPARNFRTMAELKRDIDLLAFQKLNVLHLHLTDDEGWRIEIKRYPELTRIGSKVRDASGWTADGWFYTQEDIKELIRYADSRFVTLLPEIEMPGHSLAATTSYPWLACHDSAAYELCASKESAFEFCCNVLDEVMALFPSPYIHVGADEVRPGTWRACPGCSAKMDQLAQAGLPGDVKAIRVPVSNGAGRPFAEDTGRLQGWFIRRIDQHVASAGKRMIGWDEILEGGLQDESRAAVMAWRDTEATTLATARGHNVAVCLYPKYYISDTGNFTQKTCYEYEPVPAAANDEQKGLILGIQGAVWGGEWAATQERIEQVMVPGSCALAEAAWTPVALKDYADFTARSTPFVQRLLSRPGVHQGLGVSSSGSAPQKQE